MPMIALATIAPTPITRSASGMSSPDCMAAWRALAMPMPAANPIAVATMPMASASAATVSTTWRRDAPIARISAASRARWATRIENVLWMLKAATTMAMPEKASSTDWKNPRKSLSTSRCCSALSSAPVIAS